MAEKEAYESAEISSQRRQDLLEKYGVSAETIVKYFSPVMAESDQATQEVSKHIARVITEHLADVEDFEDLSSMFPGFRVNTETYKSFKDLHNFGKS